MLALPRSGRTRPHIGKGHHASRNNQGTHPGRLGFGFGCLPSYPKHQATACFFDMSSVLSPERELSSFSAIHALIGLERQSISLWICLLCQF